MRSSKPTVATQDALTSRSEPTLLGIPTELRLDILDFVLVEANKIVLTDTTKPPRELYICSQMYSEGRPIWYCKNQFEMDMHDCDATLATKWADITAWRSKVPKHTLLHVRLLGTPNWGNLMKWCKGTHKGESPGLKQWPLDQMVLAISSDMHAVVAPALEIAEYSRSRKETWEVCEVVLRSLRRAALKIDGRWLAGWDGQS